MSFGWQTDKVNQSLCFICRRERFGAKKAAGIEKFEPESVEQSPCDNGDATSQRFRRLIINPLFISQIDMDEPMKSTVKWIESDEAQKSEPDVSCCVTPIWVLAFGPLLVPFEWWHNQESCCSFGSSWPNSTIMINIFFSISNYRHSFPVLFFRISDSDRIGWLRFMSAVSVRIFSTLYFGHQSSESQSNRHFGSHSSRLPADQSTDSNESDKFSQSTRAAWASTLRALTCRRPQSKSVWAPVELRRVLLRRRPNFRVDSIDGFEFGLNLWKFCFVFSLFIYFRRWNRSNCELKNCEPMSVSLVLEFAPNMRL